MKKRVKMLESIAGLADPRPQAVLEEKYSKLRIENKRREKPLSEFTIESRIDDLKKRDRYGEVSLGFPRDWSFKPGDEPLINAELAEKWEEGGLCVAVEGKKAA
jgi:hypothetical protein